MNEDEGSKKMRRLFGRVLAPVFAISVASFLGEEVMRSLAGTHLCLLGILFGGLILLFRLYYFELSRRYDSRVVRFLYISLLCFTCLFFYSIRIYVFDKIGF